MLSIQENLLAGSTPTERFALAKSLGFDAVEIWAEGFVGNDDTLMEYAKAMDVTGLPISGLFMGGLHGTLSADLALRDHTIDLVRQALTDAHDLRIPYVTVVPQPIHAPVEMTPSQERELLIWFVRVVNDLAAAMNTTLCLLPLESSQARVLNTLKTTHAALEEMRFHPFVAMSADLYSLHRQGEMGDFFGMLPMLRNLYVHETEHRSAQIPSQTLSELANKGYTGTLTLSVGLPMTRPHAPLEAEKLEQLRSFMQVV
jgi:sugar phosphate isomerase/epimerase